MHKLLQGDPDTHTHTQQTPPIVHHPPLCNTICTHTHMVPSLTQYTAATTHKQEDALYPDESGTHDVRMRACALTWRFAFISFTSQTMHSSVLDYICFCQLFLLFTCCSLAFSSHRIHYADLHKSDRLHHRMLHPSSYVCCVC